MSESRRTRLMRWRLNLFPAFRRTGGRITYIADDLHEIRLRLPLDWRTRNYVGTMFGGSMYAAVDPVYMVMFLHLLGRDYIVWDKSASIRFRRPARTALTARFVIPPAEVADIVEQLETREKLDRNYSTELIDRDGMRCAVVEKVLHFSRRQKSTDETGAGNDR